MISNDVKKNINHNKDDIDTIVFYRRGNQVYVKDIASSGDTLTLYADWIESN